MINKMDNIIPFPGRHRGAKTQDSQWEQFIQSTNVPDLITDIIRRFPHSPYFDYINDEQQIEQKSSFGFVMS